MIRHYKKRIVHINTNIIIASLFSILIAVYPVMYISQFIESMKILVLLSFLIDAIIDFALFGILHFFSSFTFTKKEVNFQLFRKDIVKIQNHRIVLSIVYAFIAITSHYLLMLFGLSVGDGFIISYIGALIITRTIHTIYGLRTGLFD